MIIGNPLYDTIFKYLMEDPEVAKRFLSVLIGEDILSLSFAAKEQVNPRHGNPIALFRMDFMAVIQTDQGPKKVLIEVQKAKKETDISRFRNYLGKQYSDKERLLPIITIYILGYNLPYIPESVVKVERDIKGLISGKQYIVQNDFVELLTHETYLIQVRLLKRPLRTPLEKVLSIFDQSYQLADAYLLDYPDEDVPEEVLPFVKRLQRVTAEADLKEKLELEAEIEYEYRMTIGKKEQEIRKKEQEIQEQERKIREKDQEITQKDQEITRLSEDFTTTKQLKKAARQEAEEAKEQANQLLIQSVKGFHELGMNEEKIAELLGLGIEQVKGIIEQSL